MQKYEWKEPYEFWELTLELEASYVIHFENLVNLAKQRDDQLTILKMCKMLEDQLQAVNDLEVIVKKAKQYSSMEGLYYHLDHELGKK